jgi:predicted nucleic acid-binding protein
MSVVMSPSEEQKLPKENMQKGTAIPALTVIFDANALITACKFSLEGEVLIDLLRKHCQIRIPQSVAEEATRNPQYPDAQIAAARVANGSLHVEAPTTSAPSFLKAYHLGQGEVDAICLYLSRPDEVDLLITDDLRTYLVCSRMGITVRILPDLIVELARNSRLTKPQATRIIEVTRSRYSDGIVAHSRALLEEVEDGEEEAQESDA